MSRCHVWFPESVPSSIYRLQNHERSLLTYNSPRFDSIFYMIWFSSCYVGKLSVIVDHGWTRYLSIVFLIADRFATHLNSWWKQMETPVVWCFFQVNMSLSLKKWQPKFGWSGCGPKGQVHCWQRKGMVIPQIMVPWVLTHMYLFIDPGHNRSLDAPAVEGCEASKGV